MGVQGLQVPRAAPCPPRPGRVTQGALGAVPGWGQQPPGAQATFTLRSTRRAGRSRSARGWSWARWSGAGRPEPTDTDGHEVQL